MRKALWVAVLLSLSAPLAAEELYEKKPAQPKPDCLDGVKYDDGKFENGLRSTAFDDNFVMLIEAPFYPAKLEKVCIAWRRTSFWTEIFFDLRIWAADGPDGVPGKLIDVIPVLFAARIPTKAKFYNYDVSGYGIVIDGPVYIGPFWDPLDAFLIYLATDYGPKTPRQRAFHGVGILDDHPPNVEIGTSIDQAPKYRAFGIRAKFGPP
jgi:hypothetical protein